MTTPLLRARAAASLSRSRWFARQPERLRQTLTERALISDIEAGRWIYGTGDALNGLYGVVAGSVHLLSGPESTLLDIVQAGQLFGQAARFGGGPRLVTAVAGERTTLLFVPDHALRDIAAHEPDVWRNFTELLYGQLAGALLLSGVSRLPPGKRVAGRLALLAATHGETAAVSVTQGQLAELTGLSRKTVNAHLQWLEKAGAIALRYGRITVRDIAHLRTLAGLDAAS